MIAGAGDKDQRINTLRSGKIANSIVTILAVAIVCCFLYVNRFSQLLDEMEVLVGEQFKAWNSIIDYGDYLNSPGLGNSSTRLVEDVQRLLGERLDGESKIIEVLGDLSRTANAWALPFIFPDEIASIGQDGIDPGVRRFVGRLRRTPPALVEARFSELQPAESVLFFSRKVLLPLQQRAAALRTMRIKLTSLRTAMEWSSAILLPLAIWGVWFMVLRPSLAQSLELQARIEASERRARITLSSIGEAVVVVGADGKIVTLNSAALDLVGVEEYRALGRPLGDFVEFRMSPPVAGLLISVANLIGQDNPNSHTVEIVRLKLTGAARVRSVELTAAPIAYPGRPEQGGVLVIRDTTDQQKLREELHTADKARAVLSLAAGLAHEFNNALAVISGARELMALKLQSHRECSGLVGRHIKAIEDAVRQSTGLTGQLLAIGSQGRLELSTISLMEPLRDVMSTLAESSNNSVEVVLDTELDDSECFIRGNATALRRAFLHLGKNSLQAIDGRGQIRITVTSRQDCGDVLPVSLARPKNQPQRCIVLEWRDSGGGISSAHLQRIFEPFFTTRQAEGLPGLGLPIVKGVVAEHQGTIVASSTPGEGAAFTVYLPASDPLERDPSPDVRPAKVELPALRILVVEDEAEFASAVSEYFALHGFQVEVAANGNEAIACFKRDLDAFDIVLLDLNLPEKSGFEVEAEIRALRPQCKIIASTGNLEVDSGKFGSLDKSTRVLKKPYGLDELLEAVHRVYAA